MGGAFPGFSLLVALGVGLFEVFHLFEGVVVCIPDVCVYFILGVMVTSNYYSVLVFAGYVGFVSCVYV